MSTRKYRETLRAQGVDLDGKDIDHIIPRSRGGPDLPWNYNPLDASINRSLQANGMWWKLTSCPLETMNAWAKYASYLLMC
ncbi:MAG: HNH endonuclease [Polyangiaceae bacterium]|nr:HNH endonuclease [Polyangiaceae bacterium]